MNVANCQYHPSMNSVGICPRCRRPMCEFCLPQPNKPCRACRGYRHAQTTSVAAATTVSLFIGMINPVLGLISILVLFFAFRALFRYRTRTLVRTAIPPANIPLQAEQTGGLNFCSDCSLWNDGLICKQCGKKLA